MPARPRKRSLHGWIVIAYIRSYTADINHRQRSGAALFTWQRAAGREHWVIQRGRGQRVKNRDEMKVYFRKTERWGSESDAWNFNARHCNLSETAGALSSGIGRGRLQTCPWILVNPAPAHDCILVSHCFISTLHAAQHMLNICTIMEHNLS